MNSKLEYNEIKHLTTKEVINLYDEKKITDIIFMRVLDDRVTKRQTYAEVHAEWEASRKRRGYQPLPAKNYTPHKGPKLEYNEVKEMTTRQVVDLYEEGKVSDAAYLQILEERATKRQTYAEGVAEWEQSRRNTAD